MAPGRRPGPLGGASAVRAGVNDGTLKRRASPAPGPLRPAGAGARRRIRRPHRGLPQLNWGSRGDDVKRLQRLLNVRVVPGPKLKLDGVFGNKTYAAVRAFQQGREIRVDGVVGPVTWAHLFGGHQVKRASTCKGLPVAEAPPPAAAPAEPRPHGGKTTLIIRGPGGTRVYEGIDYPITVFEWSFERKMAWVIRRMPDILPEEAARTWVAMVQPDNLLLAIVIVGLFSMLSGGVALALGIVAFVADVGSGLALALQTIALSGSEEELDAGARELADVIAAVGVAVFLAAITKAAGGARASKGERGTAPHEPSPPPRAEPARPFGSQLPHPAPMNPTLARMRQLPRDLLLKEIRKAAGEVGSKGGFYEQDLVLWEQIEYGAVYRAVRAGKEMAAKLGVREGDVIGYQTEGHISAKSRIMGMDELALEELSPYGDVFLDYAPAR